VPIYSFFIQFYNKNKYNIIYWGINLNKVNVNYQDPSSYLEVASFIKDYINIDTIIICVGTDKCIGDSLGPIVGSMLIEKGIPLTIYGTLDNPIHALNLSDKIDTIRKKHFGNLIGIDACIGDEDSIGNIQARDYPLHPGKGVGKTLPDIGETSIIGIVDGGDDFTIFTNRNIRLSLVVNMAKVITMAIIEAYNISIKKNKS
jgi:putative sporulation protein YyaC